MDIMRGASEVSVDCTSLFAGVDDIVGLTTLAFELGMGDDAPCNAACSETGGALCRGSKSITTDIELGSVMTLMDGRACWMSKRQHPS